ncbi:MAG: hypothetical protein Q8K59_02575 [Nitrosomonas sp.]|nr:hypothetical protein [Nitrosomonas sp.]MDP1949977.1 hypothetical protein [Nitrosomonas sp.]
MKRFLIAAMVAVATVTTPALAADVGVSVNIGQPGFYGRINIGGFPQPQVIYPQPIIIQQMPVNREPVYLHVPPGHAKNWRKHCREYNACGEQVYFVQSDWYNREYAPRYQKKDHDHQNKKQDKHNNKHNEGHKNGGHGNDHKQGHGH